MSQKILVIDDSLATSKLAEAVIAQNFRHIDVLVAQCGADAFERFHLAQPELILLDETIPDMDAEAICFRLLNDPATAGVPVVLMATNGHGEALADRYSNVQAVLTKPVTPASLTEVVGTTLRKAKALPRPATRPLFHDLTRIVFSGHTGFFSLRSALQMAHGDQLTGVLRLSLNRHPIELFLNQGRFLFATTRNAQLYCGDSPAILSSTSLGKIVESQAHQAATGCPMFLQLSSRSGFPHDDVVQIVRDHGQRAFAHLWTAGRVSFEFEDMEEFPDYVKNFPVSNEDPDNWVLGTLRHVRFENLLSSQRPDPNGSPAYTRRGYELVQKLKVNDVEARFATAINGSESLQSIAKRIGIPLNDALLIVFRFATLEVIDYWSSSVLALPSGEPVAE
jgi:CheY-like chemotaxis protein